MKKIISAIMITIMLVLLISCQEKTPILPKYDSKESYYGKGVQDRTDYCKYFYNENSIKKFETYEKFKKVTDANIGLLRSYFSNFEKWVKYEDYYEKYDFIRLTQIKEGDYFYIYTNAIDSFDVYYVDMEKQILYFIHSNT